MAMKVTKCHVQAVSTSDLCSGGLKFKSQPGYQLS
jgi:hypothetical protein